MIRRGINYTARSEQSSTLLDLYLPDGVARPPLAVWIHGGGFVGGDRVNLPGTFAPGSIFSALNSAGLACASIDYRLAPAHPFPAAVEDVRGAIAFLHARAGHYGYDPDRIGVWGESAGGMLALAAGLSRPEVRATVAWYPVTDFTAFPDTSDHRTVEVSLFGAPADAVAEIAAEASPINHVTAAAPPTLLVHGEQDSVVPVSHSRRMHERLLEAGADSALHTVPGADHCFDRYPDIPALINEAVSFLALRLGGSPR